MVKTAIVNVVATATLSQRLDLDELGKFSEILHDSDIYGGRVAYFKIPDMEGKVSIFSSGKIISVGTTSQEKALHELESAKSFLVEKGFAPLTLSQQNIRNIVVTADFGESVDLGKLAKNRKMIYEPDQFPAGIMRFEDPYGATVLIFASGKTVITGLKSSSHIKPLIQKMVPIIKACKLSE